MTKRQCSASIILDIARSSIHNVRDVTPSDVADFNAHIRAVVLAEPKAMQVFEALHLKRPILCKDKDSYPTHEQVNDHIEDLLNAFNLATKGSLGLAGDPESRAFPAELRTESKGVTPPGTLSCIHWEWDPVREEWVMVVNRDLAIVGRESGVLLDATHTGFDDGANPDFRAVLRIIMAIGDVTA
ncbi:MAG: hypothetical protein P1V81_15075 [Planctomycetota bacterium]|nr:hypothetical protein [Planctomycetota bacterium]